MSLDGLSCAPDYPAERPYLTAGLGGGFQLSTPKSTPPTNLCQLTLQHALLIPFLCRQQLKRKPSGSLSIDKVRVTPCTSLRTWQLRRNESQEPSTDSSGSSYPCCERLCTSVRVAEGTSGCNPTCLCVAQVRPDLD